MGLWLQQIAVNSTATEQRRYEVVLSAISPPLDESTAHSASRAVLTAILGGSNSLTDRVLACLGMLLLLALFTGTHAESCTT